jgi:beta-galactosidase/beta-glucuronidase
MVRSSGLWTPYVPQEFEFTKLAQEGENEIIVVIADLVAFANGDAKTQIDFGIHPGFEAYGGIIRDVWAEVRPTSFVENVRLAYELRNNYSACTARPRVTVSSGQDTLAHVETVLYHNKEEVARCSVSKQIAAGVTDVHLTFDFEPVALWAPEIPNLYELTTYLKTESSDDSWSCRTGFREIRIVGREFRLNGKRLVLNGVCRHDMWKDQGFTLSRQQQDQDMRMIKALGCNFVRLVHYPHDRRILELADELGLLVSEEPGFLADEFSDHRPGQNRAGVQDSGGNHPARLERTLRDDLVPVQRMHPDGSVFKRR